MSPAAARRRRSPATLFVGVLLALLALGLGCGPAAAASAASSAPSAPSVRAAVAEVPAASAPDGDPGAGTGTGTGCGKKKDRGAQPAAPNRGASAQEQLQSTLSYEHDAPGGLPADGPFAEVAPDRGPPPRDPPSPVELSVLRV
ncbi:hypothetical protein [Streptomyces sp. Da 82-17]|uniref:hypothetical protein n=1 Tax=Streptomyces sp. Da 82-17 TaxID=3377116 RepID=UPI0038D412E9